MFAYCLNNPTGQIDPNGTTSISRKVPSYSSYDMGAGSVGGLPGDIIIITATFEAVDRLSEEICALALTLTAEEAKRTQHVYSLYDPSTMMVMYVGRTNNPSRRLMEHRNDINHPERRYYEMNIIMSGLTLDEARFFEQLFISAFTLDHLENARREIAVGKVSSYSQHLQAAKSIVNGATEDALLNLLGR